MKEQQALYSSPNTIRAIKLRRSRLVGHIARMVLRPEEKETFGRPRRTWEDCIKMDLREIGFRDVDWIHLAQARDQ